MRSNRLQAEPDTLHSVRNCDEDGEQKNVNVIERLLLACGIVSSLFYAGMDVIGGTRWQSYSWIAQEFSRLSAIGAPSRSLHLVLSPIYTMLVVAFGLAIRWLAGRRRALRVVGGALVVYAVVSLLWPQFFPEDLTAPVSAFTNTMHIILTVVTVFTMNIYCFLKENRNGAHR